MSGNDKLATFVVVSDLLARRASEPLQPQLLEYCSTAELTVCMHRMARTLST